jgi:hypothetical protein
MVRFVLATLAAFLMFLRAAALCLADMISPRLDWFLGYLLLLFPDSQFS